MDTPLHELQDWLTSLAQGAAKEQATLGSLMHRVQVCSNPAL